MGLQEGIPAHAIFKLLWVKILQNELGVVGSGPMTLCDNTLTRHITSNVEYHECTKNIEVDCHSIREKVRNKEIRLERMNSKSYCKFSLKGDYQENIR